MKTKPALSIESPYPTIFTLTADEIALITEQHHAWHDHLAETDALSAPAVQKRHDEVNAAVRAKRCRETVEAFRALPDLSTDQKRCAELAGILADELNHNYRLKWQARVVAACRRIAGEVRKWLVGYGDEMRPRFEALNLPFAPILTGEPYALAWRIIRGAETFADAPERDFTQLGDIIQINIREEVKP
jgi:hypothetical protein